MRTSKVSQFFASHRTAFLDMVHNAASCKANVSELKIGIRNSGDDDDSIQIQIHDVIGDEWNGTDSKTILDQVKASSGKPIYVDINSLGGSAYDGISIYNALASHDAEVHVMVSGIAYSAASIIAMAGDHVTMGEGSNFGIHPAWLFTMGNQHALRDTVKWLETLDNGLIDIYAARTGHSRDQIENWFIGDNNDGTFFSAEDAVKYGFADELAKKKKKKSMTSSAASGAPPQAVMDRLEMIRRTQQTAAVQARLQRIEEIRQSVAAKID